MHDYSQHLKDARKKPAITSDDEEDDTILSSTNVHQKSCRSVVFSNTDPNLLFSSGNDASIAGLYVDRAMNMSSSDSSCIAWKIPNAHPNKNGIHRMFQLPNTSPAGPLLATGDDEGIVRLWDTRICGNNKNKNNIPGDILPSSCVAEWKHNTDFISGFACSKDGNTLLSTSGDCTLSVFDIRKAISYHTKNEKRSYKALAQSEQQGDELLSIAIIKNGKKVVTGTHEGVLTVWSYDKWEDHSDRFPGHPQSIDALLKIDEDTIITGSSDGLLRVVQILPDKLLGVVGDHNGFPVEELQFERNRRLIGSVSHDEMIRLWDASFLHNDDEDDTDIKDNDMQAVDLMRESGKGLISTATKKPTNESDDEWEDMDDDDDDDDDEDNISEDSKARKDGTIDDSDDSDDSEDDNRAKKKPKFVFKTHNEKFFEDL